MTIKVFISYKHQDLERNQWVENFYKDLRAAGIDAKLDQYEVPPGESFSDYMARGIRESDCVLFIVTPKAVEAVELGSGALAFEMQISNARRLKGQDDFSIIPIFREGEETSTYLSDHRYLDFRADNSYDLNFATLIQWLYKRIAPPELGEASTVQNEREIINLARNMTKKARLAFNSNAYENALALLRTAIHLDAENTESWGLLGRVLNNMGRFEEAIPPLSQAIERSHVGSNRRMHLIHLTLAYYFLGNYNLALDSANRIIREKENHREGLRTRAIVWLAQGNVENSLEDINECIRLRDNYFSAHAVKALIFSQFKDITNAYTELDICERISPDEATDYYYFALACANLYQYKNAIKFLKIAIQKDIKCRPRAKNDLFFKIIKDQSDFIALVD